MNLSISDLAVCFTFLLVPRYTNRLEIVLSCARLGIDVLLYPVRVRVLFSCLPVCPPPFWGDVLPVAALLVQ